MEHHPQTDPNWQVNKGKYSESELKALNHTDAFNYNPADQTKCPYASHMRKTGPRDDYAEYAKHTMLRRGIPYGEWCGNEERGYGITKKERGLLFVSYQSSIENGFVTQQKSKFLPPATCPSFSSNTLQNGPTPITPHRTWLSTAEESARDLMFLLVKLHHTGMASLQNSVSMLCTKILLKFPSRAPILRRLLPSLLTRLLICTGLSSLTVENTSFLPQCRL